MKTIVTRTRVVPFTPEDAINKLVATGHFTLGFVDKKVLSSVPLFEATEVDYRFDPLGKPEEVIPFTKVEEMFAAKYGCNHTPDFVGVCEMLIADPTLVDAAPIAIHWTDDDGHHCYAIWSSWSGGRRVRVDRSDGGWRGLVCFPRARE